MTSLALSLSASLCFLVNGQFGDEDLTWQTLAPETTSGFGISASISDDDETVMIGSSIENVYVYSKSSGETQYTLSQTLEPNSVDYVADGRFGESLSFDRSGLSDRVAIGAPHSGFVFIFDKDVNGDYIQTYKLSSGSTTDEFGYSVSLYSNTLVVGCNNEFGPHKSWIFEFDESINDWIKTEIIPSDILSSDNAFFGYSVSVYDETVIIGSNGENGGIVYIYKKLDGIWTEYNIIYDTIKLGYSCVSIYDNIIIATGSETNFDGMLLWDNNGNNNLILSSQSGATLRHDIYGKSCDNKQNIIISGSMLGGSKAEIFVPNVDNNGWDNIIELKPSGLNLLWGSTVAIGNDCVVATALGQSAHIVCGVSQTTVEETPSVCDLFSGTTTKLYEYYLETGNVYNHILNPQDNPSYLLEYNYVKTGFEGYIWTSEIEGLTVPLYNQFSSKYQDNYFTIDHEIPQDYVRYGQGILGYIMQAQCCEFNQPLYEYWSESKSDHLYNTNYDELGSGNGDYVFTRVVGYVAKE